MRETIVEFTLSAYQFLLPFAWLAFGIAIFVLLPMAAFPRTSSQAGLGLYITSWLFGITTWLLGAGITFAVYGWVGLVIGLFLFGIGVVPLAIFAAFFLIKNTSLGVSLIVMFIIVFAARFGGILFMQRGDKL